MPAPALRSNPTRRSIPLDRAIAEHLNSLDARAYTPSRLRPPTANGLPVLTRARQDCIRLP
jgi:hypothetical protein